MKERPILFSGPMVRALIDGRKTQTRRVVNFPKWADAAGGVEFSGLNDGPAALCSATGCFADLTCRYGAAGDRLWVRETWAVNPVREFGPPLDSSHCVYRADETTNAVPQLRWTPSIHMPRWASRINLEVTGVRVERLQEISEADSLAEGIVAWRDMFAINHDGDFNQATARHCYWRLWEEINGVESWDANPWVWVIEFKQVKP